MFFFLQSYLQGTHRVSLLFAQILVTSTLVVRKGRKNRSEKRRKRQERECRDCVIEAGGGE